MTVTTRDSISLRKAGIIHIAQPKKGHRFTLDSILLADFCRIKSGEKVLEPGAGTGIVSILLAKKFPTSSITAVEVLSSLAELCKKNISGNALEARISVLEWDITRLKPAMKPGKFDVIVANPPYTRTGTGRVSPLEERQTARQDGPDGVGAWLDLRVFLKNRGRYNLIFPAPRTGEILSLLREKKLEPKRMRLVHPYLDKPASLVLVEAVKAAGVGVEVMPPLIVHEAGGGYTEEMRGIYDV